MKIENLLMTAIALSLRRSGAPGAKEKRRARPVLLESVHGLPWDDQTGPTPILRKHQPCRLRVCHPSVTQCKTRRLSKHLLQTAHKLMFPQMLRQTHHHHQWFRTQNPDLGLAADQDVNINAEPRCGNGRRLITACKSESATPPSWQPSKTRR